MRNFQLSEAFLEEYKNKQALWGYGALSYLTYKRSYARKLESGKTEEWYQTVQRVVEGTFSIQKKHCNSFNLEWNNRKAQKSAQIMYDKIFNFKMLLPGRGLWAMGTDIVDKVGSLPLTNCCNLTTEHINIDFTEPFCTLMDFSMLGCGVGHDTKGAGKLKIQVKESQEPELFVVPDSREGWVECLKKTLEYFNGGKLYEFNYSEIRPAGSPIKTFGGVAPGPEPLKTLVKEIRELLTPIIDNPITSVAIVDIMDMIGKCVVSGNIRRSAIISLGNYDDYEFIEMKNPIKYEKELQNHRWCSNNSIFAKIGMDYSDIAEHISNNGEPGVVLMENAKSFGRRKDGVDLTDDRINGPNPSLRKGTKILTKDGIVPIEKLENKEFKVKNLNGQWSDAKCWLSGKDKPLWKISFYGGHVIYCTEEHKWPVQTTKKIIRKFETNKLRQDDKILFPDLVNELDLDAKYNYNDFTYDNGFMVGWLFGDGWISQRKKGKEAGKYTIGFFFSDKEYYLAERVKTILNKLKEEESNITQNSEKHWQIQVTSQKFIKWLFDTYQITNKNELPKTLFSSNEEFRKGFIDGLFSSDGSMSSTGKNTEKVLKFTNKTEGVVKDIACILSFYGLKSSISSSTILLNDKTFTRHDLKLNGVSTRDFASIFKFSHIEKQEKLLNIYKKGIYENRKYRNKQYAKIKTVELTNLKEDVWDITVFDNTHCFYTENCITGNCGEIILESGELCNLGNVYPAHHDSLEEFLDTLKYIYLYCKTVTLVPTHNQKTNSIIMRNRRIGVSLAGVQQAINKFGHRVFYNDFCDKGYKLLKHWDKIYSEWLGVPKSIRLTTEKPDGSTAILAGAFPGVHFPHAKRYIRNVRFSKDAPYILCLKKAGYLVEEDYYDKYSFVVSFPIDEKYYEKSKFDISLLEQFKVVSDMQNWWADNSVSCTITFKEDEKPMIKKALEMYEGELKTVSLLPLQGHSYIQAPYIEIDDSLPDSKRFKKGYRLAWTNQEFEDYKKQINEKVLYREIAKLNELDDGVGEKYCSNSTCEVVYGT